MKGIYQLGPALRRYSVLYFFYLSTIYIAYERIAGIYYSVHHSCGLWSHARELDIISQPALDITFKFETCLQ
jgi:hypothetical protein